MDIKKVAVLGAGTMGHGIAQVAAQAGYGVCLYDLDAKAVTAGRDRIRHTLEEGVSRGKVQKADADAAIERVSVTTCLSDAARDAQVVIEAVPEILALKADLFAKVAESAPADALLATNTSSLSVGEVCAKLEKPLRKNFCGLHFFNPVHLMKLVEVIHHDGTAEETMARAVAFVESLKKTPIVVKDAPGFASSRLGLLIGLEAMRMVEEGVAKPEDIDQAMKLGYGHPMGPLELTDWVGLDVRLAISDYLEKTLGDRFAAPAILRDKVKRGELGRKSGAGFYRWKDGKRV
jgi:3-hydroxybutyryl-CoA dehydrogenase